MSKSSNISFKVLLCCLILQSCLTQNNSTVEFGDCMRGSQATGLYVCDKCKTLKLETFYSNGNISKERAYCSECSSGSPNGGYKEIIPGQPLPSKFSFGDYCDSGLTWLFVAIGGGVLLVVGVALFLLRSKLPCCAKKPANYDDSLNQNSSQDIKGHI